MNNKAQNEGSSIVALLSGIIIFSALAISAMMFLQGGAETYGVTYNDSEFKGFNKTSEITDITQDLNEKFIDTNTTGTSTLDIISLVTTAGFSSIKIIGSSSTIYYAVLVQGGDILLIDRTFVFLAALIIVIVLISIFILLVMKVR